MQSQWETTFGCYFTPNRPIYTRMGSIDSDEFRASIGVIIPTPNRNRKSLLRSLPISMQSQWETTFGYVFHSKSSDLHADGLDGLGRIPGIDRRHHPRRRTGTGSRYYARYRFPCKVNGKLLSAAYFTPKRPIYTRMGSIDSDEFRASIGVIIPTPNRNRKSLLRSFRFPCKVNGKLHSAAISLQIVRFTRGWARWTRTNSGHRSASSSRRRTGTGSRYYARSHFHAKSMGNYFRLLFHSKSSDLHADGLDRLGRIPGIDQ
jgi:hypothetical protein